MPPTLDLADKWHAMTRDERVEARRKAKATALDREAGPSDDSPGVKGASASSSELKEHSADPGAEKRRGDETLDFTALPFIESIEVYISGMDQQFQGEWETFPPSLATFVTTVYKTKHASAQSQAAS